MGRIQQVIGLLALAIGSAALLWWAGAGRDTAVAPPADGAARRQAAAAASGPAAVPASAPTLLPTPLPTPALAAAGIASAAVRVPPPAGMASAATRPMDTRPSTTLSLAQFARQWLDAEARGGASADLDALRSYYAPTVAYRGQGAADWATIAADKARFARRWPQRQYQLQRVQRLADHADDHADGTQRVLLHFSWQLERQGRWQRGQSVTLLELRTVDGQWRIVGEQPG